MDIKIKWKDNKGKWQFFDVRDINHTSRDHVLHLFQLGTPVIAKENTAYLTNKDLIMADYRAKGKKCDLFSTCQPSKLPFSQVGFLGRIA